jgi:hypothetical protein
MFDHQITEWCLWFEQGEAPTEDPWKLEICPNWGWTTFGVSHYEEVCTQGEFFWFFVP